MIFPPTRSRHGRPVPPQGASDLRPADRVSCAASRRSRSIRNLDERRSRIAQVSGAGLQALLKICSVAPRLLAPLPDSGGLLRQAHPAIRIAEGFADHAANLLAGVNDRPRSAPRMARKWHGRLTGGWPMDEVKPLPTGTVTFLFT